MIIACLNFRSHPIIEELEARTGRPVVTSTQATLWHVLRLAGVATPIASYGQLLKPTLRHFLRGSTNRLSH